MDNQEFVDGSSIDQIIKKLEEDYSDLSRQEQELEANLQRLQSHEKCLVSAIAILMGGAARSMATSGVESGAREEGKEPSKRVETQSMESMRPPQKQKQVMISENQRREQEAIQRLHRALLEESSLSSSSPSSSSSIGSLDLDLSEAFS